jgi:glutathione S-transferase
MAVQLYTFTISHFSEKARWALDLEGVRYQERALLPGLHLLKVKRLAARSTVPILEHDGRIVQGSGAILDYTSSHLGGKRLTPTDAAELARARELESLADHAFGLGIQRIFYAVLLEDRSIVIDLWSQRGPRWASLFYGVAFPGVSRAVRRLYKISPDVVARAKDRFREGMATIDRALAERPYLGGESPNRADVTVAALLAPMCMPAGHVVRWPAAPPSIASFTREFEGGATWKHVLRMYQEHRPRPAA